MRCAFSAVRTERSLKTLLVSLALSFTAGCSPNGGEFEWYLLHPRDGCVPFDEGQGTDPSVNHMTPEQALVAARKTELTDAEMMPFMDYLASQNKPLSEKAKTFYEPFTNTNAFMIFSRSQNQEFGVLSKALCEEIGGFRKK